MSMPVIGLSVAARSAVHSNVSSAARRFRPRALSQALALAAILPLSMGTAFAGSFTISTNSTAAQTLGSGSGQTGTVNAGKTLSVSGANVAVTITGNNATLNNDGTITQTGTGRVIRDNTGVSGLTINNGSITNATAQMTAFDADVIQMNKAGGSVTLNNYGSMISQNASGGGSQAVDFSAITTGSNVVNNYAGGLLKATEADAVRPGVNGVVNNWGNIQSTTTTGSSSDGVDLQNNSGGVINNYSGANIIGARHGITGGAVDNTVNFTTTVTNNGTIQGNNGSGLNLDGFNAMQTATIVNHGTISGNGVTGDGDGIDVDGVVNITNTGTIRSINSFSTTTPGQSEGITVGGGIITNSGLIVGQVAAGNTNAVGRGITLAGVDTSGTPEPIYVNSVITNLGGGVIQGQTDSAIVVGGAASGFTVTINNNAGAAILGGSTSAAAIVTGADNDTLNNAGTIDGASSGKAIDMGAGNNTLNITGGAATIRGDINGGTGGHNVLTMALGGGNSFTYTGAISNFDLVEIQSGTVTLPGASLYTGATRVSGGTLVLDGANRLAAGSSLEMNGGTLQIANAGFGDAQTFASLSLLDSSVIDLGGNELTFNGLAGVVGGKTLTLLDFLLGGAYALRFVGDYSSNADFLALIGATRIDGHAAGYYFDGAYTDVVAVSEPASYAVLLEGLGLLALITRCRKQRS
jgi:hypothetical protein